MSNYTVGSSPLGLSPNGELLLLKLRMIMKVMVRIPMNSISLNSSKNCVKLIYKSFYLTKCEWSRDISCLRGLFACACTSYNLM